MSLDRPDSPRKRKCVEIMKLARNFRHAPAETYDMTYKALETAVYEIIDSPPIIEPYQNNNPIVWMFDDGEVILCDTDDYHDALELFCELSKVLRENNLDRIEFFKMNLVELVAAIQALPCYGQIPGPFEAFYIGSVRKKQG